ncbi:MAG: efflux RND transporter periplasmic adaptor subunit [Selenomonadaceae bacterium]|nr:efflux RND transporter periplasmic adaptor subunit [Selenomonadaceae bacterium]MBQ6131832.1 efflux RND transporter periplasmic adaptor subunit [Selenomonadaceae bacterium]MBQ7492982.1 efflux RND transporter periplasmic adaptor subunit [Selenomonadaceae bacterium]
MTMAAVFAASSIIFGGCGDDKNQQQAQMPKAQVKAMKVIRRDTPLAIEYAGHLVGTEEVKVQSKVSGNVVEKYVVGGQFVEQGQLLYQIDSRQYNSAVLRAQADLAQAEAVLQQSVATYNNSLIDLQRNEKLFEESAIPEQAVTTQAATVRANEATCAANEAAIYACQAALRTAQENLDDTKIYAPMSGQLGVDDVSVGTFVSAGQTTLVTLGAPDPIFVQFSISESDYLHFMTVQNMQSEHNPIDVTITLADGKEYPFGGRIVEIDRELANSTGSLIMKAIFPNPSGLLMPGMFARVKLSGEIIPNAVLVPQRSVQQLLGKSFVMVVGKENKSEARTVELGEQVGSYFVVTSGVNQNDTVVVEGLTNLREGVELAVTTVTPGEMGFTLANVTSTYNADAGLDAPNRNPNAPDNLRGR